MQNEINIMIGGYDDGRTPHVQQYDVASRVYVCRLWERPDVPYRLADDAIVGAVFSWRRVSGSHEYKTEIVNRSTVKVTVPAEAMQLAGKVDFQLAIHENGGVLHTPIISFVALKSLKASDKETDEPALLLVSLVNEAGDAIMHATHAAENAESAAQRATIAAGGASTATNSARNAASDANSAAFEAQKAKQLAEQEAAHANAEAQNASEKAQEAAVAVGEANAAAKSAVDATNAANAAAEKANEAAENAKISAEPALAAIEQAKQQSVSDVQQEGTVQTQVIARKGAEVLDSLPDDYMTLAGNVEQVSDEMVSIYANDFVYRNGVYQYKATSDGTYKSFAVTLEGWMAGETYTCEIGSVENNASNVVATVEAYDTNGTRLQQVTIEANKALKNVITLADNTASFKLIYRPAFTESITAGTVVTYRNVSIYAGDMKRLSGYDGHVNLTAFPDLWTQGATVNSSNGNIASNPDRVVLAEYLSLPHGFVCLLPSPYMMSVARYDEEHNYLGYDSINKNRIYTPEECVGKLFRFTISASGGKPVTLNDLSAVGISFIDDAQNVAKQLQELHKKVESTIVEPIPDYFVAEIDTTANDTLAVTNAPCITFALVADTHQNATAKTVRNISAVDERVNFDSILHLGDVMSTMGDAQYFYDECYAEIEAYRKSVQSGKLYATPGNHDGYAADGKNDVSLDNELYRTMFRVADERTRTIRNGDKPYYYVDFERNKVRFIFLSSKSYTMTGGVYTYVYGFNNEQVEWLLDVLEHTDDGWSIMVCSHIPPIDTVLNSPTYNVGITGNNGQNIVNILQAWKNRTSVTFNGKTHDFSDLTANKFIAWMCGHVHGDMVKVHQDLTFVTVTAVAAFVPSWEMPEGGSFVPERTANTLTWDSWNSCVLRPDESKLYLFRFGAGNDMVVSY